MNDHDTSDDLGRRVRPDGRIECPRCFRAFQPRGLASHLAAHKRDDGQRAAEVARIAATLVRRYDRIDDLAQAIAYQVKHEAGELAPRAVTEVAQAIALAELRRLPVTSAVRAALAAGGFCVFELPLFAQVFDCQCATCHAARVRATA